MMFVSRRVTVLVARVFVARIVVVFVVAITLVVTRVGLPFREIRAAHVGIAVLEFVLPLIAHLLEHSFLALFQVAANVRVFSLGLPALAKLIVQAFVQVVYLVIEIGFQIPARVLQFRSARGKLIRRSQQEGTNYEGISDPGAFHGVCLLVQFLFGSPENQIAAFDL
jgi:hypothetical protein